MANMAVAVSNAKIVDVTGRFHRHTSRRVAFLEGSSSGGRWGPPGSFAVMYLGRPVDSVTIEAYRHLVDPVEGMTAAAVVPRKLWTVDIAVTEILDVRDPESRFALGLSDDDLHSTVDDYIVCQSIALAAHQLGLHGIIAPAAEGDGETLALFDAKLPVAEFPSVLSVNDTWSLPHDPRILRIVDSEERSRPGSSSD